VPRASPEALPAPGAALASDLRPLALRAGVHRAIAQLCRAVAAARGIDLPDELLGGGEGAPHEHSPLGPIALKAAALDPSRVIGEAHERLLEGGDGEGGAPAAAPGTASARKRSGAYYTPAALIERTLDAVLDPAERDQPASPIRFCDPACGSGLFLVAAARRLAGRGSTGLPAAIVESCLFGIDISPAAAAATRAALWIESGGRADPAALLRNIRCADALLDPLPPDWPLFDAIAGNPPFLNQLQSATAHDRARAAALAARYGPIARGYADTSAVFLALALSLARPGARVALIQPQSLLAARDAAPARAEALRRAELIALWAEPPGGPRQFRASVRVCTPTLRVRPIPLPHAPAQSWAPRLADHLGLPAMPMPAGPRLADIAAATADFRDQYYGLRRAVLEGAGIEDPALPPLITTGLLDPARCLWGLRPARLFGALWTAPRADLSRLDPPMLRWGRLRLVPKVLLATQTRILEVCADPRGQWLPVVPLISITPRSPGRLWHIAAAVGSPVATLWAARNFAGAGLSADAIKLSARQSLDIPIPCAGTDWDRAAREFRLASSAPSEEARRRSLLASARSMCRAFGLKPDRTREVLAWWAPRLPDRSGLAPAAHPSMCRPCSTGMVRRYSTAGSTSDSRN
jgi:hypothetical protein